MAGFPVIPVQTPPSRRWNTDRSACGEGFLDKPVSGGARQQNVTDLQIGRELQLDRDETEEAAVRTDPHEFGRADQAEEPKGGCSFDTGAAMQMQIHQSNAQIRSKMVRERRHSQLQGRMRHFWANFPAHATHMKQLTDDTEGSQLALRRAFGKLYDALSCGA